MTQPAIFGSFLSGPANPTAYSVRINDSLNALLTENAGASAPSYADLATRWADTSVAGTITVKQWDGGAWRSLYAINVSTGTVTFSLGAGTVGNAALANMAQATVKGRASGAGTGQPTDLAASDLFAIMGGLVPAKPQTAAGAGQFVAVVGTSGVAYSLPSGGTWAWVITGFSTSSAVLSTATTAGVSAGGTQIWAATSGQAPFGFAWRIA